MEFDVWFARTAQAGSKIAFSFAQHGNSPSVPMLADSVSHALGWVRKNQGKVVQVGILPPDALGL